MLHANAYNRFFRCFRVLYVCMRVLRYVRKPLMLWSNRVCMESTKSIKTSKIFWVWSGFIGNHRLDREHCIAILWFQAWEH